MWLWPRCRTSQTQGRRGEVVIARDRVEQYLRQHPGARGVDIRNALDMSRRTLYGALQALKDQGKLRQRPSLKDTRFTYFYIANTPETEPHAATA